MTARTHTYAVLDVSPETYREIRARLVEAGYEHAFHQEKESRRRGEVIDMHGIALQADPSQATVRPEPPITRAEMGRIVREAMGQ